MPTYIIRAGKDGPVKIGRADDVERRCAELQTAHHETLEILRVIDTAFDAEPVMHEMFAELRIRGEWFTFREDMLTCVPMAPSAPDPDDVSLGAALLRYGNKRAAARLGVTTRTVDSWIDGATFPNWKQAAAMMRDPEIAPLFFTAIGRPDLADPEKEITRLLAEVRERRKNLPHGREP